MKNRSFAIGMLARLTGTSVETIRLYERIGLIPAPGRTGRNHRFYELSHLNRLSFIRRTRDIGFSLDQIRALLDLSDNRNHPCEALDVMARGHLAEVQQKIDDLKALQAELERIVAHCSYSTLADCKIIEALSPDLDNFNGL